MINNLKEAKIVIGYGFPDVNSDDFDLSIEFHAINTSLIYNYDNLRIYLQPITKKFIRDTYSDRFKDVIPLKSSASFHKNSIDIVDALDRKLHPKQVV